MAGVAPAPTQTPSHVSRPPIPPGLVPAAVLLAAAVGFLALLPSLAQAVWEVPHLLLLGLVVSYGVFTQRNNAADAGGNAAKEGSLAWNARYHPDDPLVVVADHAAPSDDGDAGQEGAARERPLSLPVRRLKASPAAAAAESETDGDATSDAFGEDDTDSCASSSAGFWAGARAVPSPPSVLDADVGLSSCSQPRSPSPLPFSVHNANNPRRPNAAATPPSMSKGFVVPGYRLSMPHDEQPWSDDDEGATDWEDEDVAEVSDEMTMSSDRSGRGGGEFAAACASGRRDGNGEDGDTSVDEELFELAMKAEPDGEEEVDRKADEFIAKFREQIRLQRH